MHDSLQPWIAGAVAGPVGQIEPEHVVETHVSWVVITADLVFKIRKPVCFPFLDYSSVDRRWAATRAEHDLGASLSPSVYVGVWTWLNSTCSPLPLGGEPVLVMNRLPLSWSLGELIRSGSAAEVVPAIACELADLHSTCAMDCALDGRGSIAHIQRSIAANFTDVDWTRSPSDVAGAVANLRKLSEKWLVRLAPTFNERIAAGMVRDGHGDLRLSHVYFDGAKVHLIDPLEFSKDLRVCDVASEIAFLAMELDLEFPDARLQLGPALIDAYAKESNDASLREVVSFFSCYRALVRAKIEFIAAEQAPSTGGSHWESVAAAVALAERYCSAAPGRR